MSINLIKSDSILYFPTFTLFSFLFIKSFMYEMNKNICCNTYQTFPAATANSLQTIKNIDSFVKNRVM